MTDTAVTELKWQLEEDRAIGTSRKIALLDEETRVKFVISDITIIGPVEFKQPGGKTNVSYQLGVGLTSNRTQKYADNGDSTGRFVQFFLPFSVQSFSTRSNIVKSGLLDAAGVDQILTNTTNKLIEALMGKQVSGLIAHRKYLNKEGQEAIAMDVEKFKSVTEEDDFTECLAAWKPHYMAANRFADKRVITLANIQNNTAPNTVGSYSVDGDAPVKKEVTSLD